MATGNARGPWAPEVLLLLTLLLLLLLLYHSAVERGDRQSHSPLGA
jgi:hypothetical protein